MQCVGGSVLYHMRILYRTRMVCTIRVWYIPYAYGTIFRTIRVWYRHTRMVRTICVLCLFSALPSPSYDGLSLQAFLAEQT